MTMTSPMMPAVTYVLWVRRRLRRLIRARKCLHKWSTWCQQRSMRWCMTKRDLRIRCFPFVRFLSTGSAPSLMRLRHFNLSRVSSFQFNCRLQNCPYFCVFKHARAVKQKVWNEAENRERDRGRERDSRASRHALPISLLILRKKPTVLQSSSTETSEVIRRV